MKKTFIAVTLAMLTIALLTISAVPGTTFKTKKQTLSVEGTWQLVSYKYGSSTSGFIDCPEGFPRLKMINKTHFVWVNYNTESGSITQSAGGKYTLIGNTYTEFLEFGLGMDQYLKTNPQYTLKIEGDILFQSGNLTPDYKIEEIWKRVK
ncbi:MAG: hypothetical protein NT092_04770 [Bacteroidia bacterium]|nr:hypothetical protein [Bacteroidia bacterium]